MPKEVTATTVHRVVGDGQPKRLAAFYFSGRTLKAVWDDDDFRLMTQSRGVFDGTRWLKPDSGKAFIAALNKAHASSSTVVVAKSTIRV